MGDISERAQKNLEERQEFVDNVFDKFDMNVNFYLKDPIKYSLNSKGKRLRPIICMLSCEIFGGSYRDTTDAFIALELIHNGTLIHDDVIDDDNFRRGQNSVHTKFGNKRAILAGDILLSLSLKYAVKTGKIGIVGRLSDAAVKMVQGVAIQTQMRGKVVSMQQYLDLAYLKSGSLFETAAVIGGLLKDIDDESVRKISNFGKYFGLAYQIRDDITDMTTDPASPTRSDIANGDISLPLIYALESKSIRQSDHDMLSKIFEGKLAEYREADVLRIYNETGALDKTVEKMEYYAEESSRALESFSGTAVDGLRELLDQNFTHVKLLV